MSISNYSDLVTAVSNWLARDDLASQAPNFISLAEAKLNRSLRCQQMEKRSYATVNSAAVDPQYISLPFDFQTMRSVCLTSVEEKPRLQYLNDDQIKDYRSNIGDLVSTPRFFSVFGSELELVPKPDADYVLEMIYRALLPGLSLTNPTNWLIILAPDAYLYGALLEASAYMKNDARIPVWTAGFTSAIDSLNTLTKDTVN
jgi:hypothetical protein